MGKKIKDILPLAALSVFPTLLVWLPFFIRAKSFWGIPLREGGMATIIANYDGPLYMVIAKTFYNTQLIAKSFQFPLPTNYYAAHFPLYPLIISTISIISGLPYALLLATTISSILALYFFNKLAKEIAGNKNALWLTTVFSILPARWLVVRSVGSPEPLFIAAIIASIYYFRNKKYWHAGIWGALAQLTKSPGILLFIAFSLAVTVPKIKSLATKSVSKASEWLKIFNLKNTYPLLLVPISLLGLFVLYGIRFNDFFAYFHSGDNIHLLFPPFQIFNYSAPWVGTFWLEEIIFVYLLGLLGLMQLLKKKHFTLAWFVAVFFGTILFVSHRDIIRYSLPVVPFILLAFSDYISKKEFKIVFFILIIPIYLFSLAFISQNVMPISDWAPFL